MSTYICMIILSMSDKSTLKVIITMFKLIGCENFDNTLLLNSVNI